MVGPSRTLRTSQPARAARGEKPPIPRHWIARRLLRPMTRVTSLSRRTDPVRKHPDPAMPFRTSRFARISSSDPYSKSPPSG